MVRLAKKESAIPFYASLTIPPPGAGRSAEHIGKIRICDAWRVRNKSHPEQYRFELTPVFKSMMASNNSLGQSNIIAFYKYLKAVTEGRAPKIASGDVDLFVVYEYALPELIGNRRWFAYISYANEKSCVLLVTHVQVGTGFSSDDIARKRSIAVRRAMKWIALCPFRHQHGAPAIIDAHGNARVITNAELNDDYGGEDDAGIFIDPWCQSSRANEIMNIRRNAQFISYLKSDQFEGRCYAFSPELATMIEGTIPNENGSIEFTRAMTIDFDEMHISTPRGGVIVDITNYNFVFLRRVSPTAPDGRGDVISFPLTNFLKKNPSSAHDYVLMQLKSDWAMHFDHNLVAQSLRLPAEVAEIRRRRGMPPDEGAHPNS